MINKVVTSAIGAVGGILDDLFTSDEEKLTKKETMTRLLMQPDLAQTKINMVEAGHRSVFVAGWRPFVGWVCGVALAYNFIVRDLLMWGMEIWAPMANAPPELALEHLMTVLFGLLGLGGLRTYEKINGRAK